MPRSRASATAHYLVTARAGGIAPETLARAALRAARVLLLLQLVLLFTLLALTPPGASAPAHKNSGRQKAGSLDKKGFGAR